MLLFLIACSGTSQSSITCNGQSDLCSRRINEVAFAATHNAMSSAEDGWLGPNHLYAIPTQLQDGIRGLNLDTHLVDGEAYLCHGYCELGSTPLKDTLFDIKSFVDENPQEVLIITLQSAVSPDLTLESFHQSGLYDHLHHHTQGTPWPTLGELIQTQQQILLFTDSGGGQSHGYHDQWTHWVDNPYSAQSIDDFACTIERGNQETATLFNVNHFMTMLSGSQSLAEEGNLYPVLHEHVFSCWEESDKFPNQVLVDFYSIGDLFTVVDELNDREALE